MQRLKSDPLLHLVVFLTVVLVILIFVTPLTWAQGAGLFSILMVLSLTGRKEESSEQESSTPGNDSHTSGVDE